MANESLLRRTIELDSRANPGHIYPLARTSRHSVSAQQFRPPEMRLRWRPQNTSKYIRLPIIHFTSQHRALREADEWIDVHTVKRKTSYLKSKINIRKPITDVIIYVINKGWFTYFISSIDNKLDNGDTERWQLPHSSLLALSLSFMYYFKNLNIYYTKIICRLFFQLSPTRLYQNHRVTRSFSRSLRENFLKLF